MTPAEVSLILGILGLIVQAWPGILAALTGKPDDAAALEHARATLAAIPWHPARTKLLGGG